MSCRNRLQPKLRMADAVLLLAQPQLFKNAELLSGFCLLKYVYLIELRNDITTYRF